VLRLANLLHDARRFDAAIARYRAYLAARPDDPDAQVDMGICHFELRQYDQAIAAMREAVDRHPDHVQGNYNLGIVCMNAGRPRDAIAWFTATLALHPRDDIRAGAQRYLDQLTRDTQ
jgi:tetratricopeptide (TPR) repeat protein